MRFKQVFIVLFSIFICDSVKSDPDYDDLIEEIKSHSIPDQVLSDDKIDINKNLALAVLSGRTCETSLNIWKCSADCKLEYPSNGTDFPRKCQSPVVGLKCFGIPINYSYVHEPVDIQFPSEYSVLQKFPRCWKALAPLLCVRIYRPCAYHKFYHKTMSGKLETGTMEIWARIRRQNCFLVKKACADIEKEGFFPEWMNCSDEDSGLLGGYNQNRTLPHAPKFFSDTCGIGRLPILNDISGQCPHPLLEIPMDQVKTAKPLIDTCYLPCRSEQVPNFYRSHQVTTQFALSVIFFVIFFFIWAYLFFFSRIYTRSIVAFCITQALFSASVYFFVWALTGSSFVADAAECSGQVRRSEYFKSFDWCVWQSVLLQSSFISSFFWLLTHYAFNIWSPCFQDRGKVKGVKLRGFLMLSITVPCVIVPLLLAFVNIQEFDGVTGLCHIGLKSTWKYLTFFILPLAVPFFIVGLSCYIVYKGRDELIHIEVLDETKNRLAKIEDHYRLRAYRFLWFKGMANDTKLDDLKKVDFREVEEAEKADIEAPEYPTELILNFSNIEERDRKPGSIYYRKLKEFEKQGATFVDMTGGIMPQKELCVALAEHYAYLYTARLTTIRERYRNGIYPRWSFCILITGLAMILFSCILHPAFIGVEPDHEIMQIKNHIRCKITALLENGTADWIEMEGADYVSDHCTLENVYSFYRADAVIAVFIILPAIPFLIIALAFVTGWVSSGGMPRARLICDNWKTCCRPSKGDDIELELLTKPDDIDVQSFPTGECHRFASSEKISAAVTNSPDLSVAISEPTDHRELENRSFDNCGRTLESVSRLKEQKKRKSMDSVPLGRTDAELAGKAFDRMHPDLKAVFDMVQFSATRDGVWSERQRNLTDLMQDLSSYLNYTKFMLNNDSVAWTLAIDVLRRIEILLQDVCLPDATPQVIMNFQGLLNELMLVVPSLSDHTSNMGTWCSAVQDAITTLRCAQTGITGTSTSSSDSNAVTNATTGTTITPTTSNIVTPVVTATITAPIISSNINAKTSRPDCSKIRSTNPLETQSSKSRKTSLKRPSPSSVPNVTDFKKSDEPKAKEKTRKSPQPKAGPSGLGASGFIENARVVDIEADDSAVGDVEPAFDAEEAKRIRRATCRPIEEQTPSTTESEDSDMDDRIDATAYLREYHAQSRMNGTFDSKEVVPIPPNPTKRIARTKADLNSHRKQSEHVRNQLLAVQKNLKNQKMQATANPTNRPIPVEQQPGIAPPKKKIEVMLPNGGGLVGQVPAAPLFPVRPAPAQEQNRALPPRNAQPANPANLPQPANPAPQPAPAAGRRAGPRNTNRRGQRGAAHEPINFLQQAINDMNNVEPRPNDAPVRVGPSNVISGYTESYSAVPRGFLTSLTDEELRLRVARLREICNERLYPQEIMYILILSGDIRSFTPHNRPNERHVKVAAFRSIFGDSPCINVSYSPQIFLRCMRRRAVTVVGAIGYHFSKCDRPFREYHPPVLPPLGMQEMENELTMGRILGADALLPIRELLREFNNGDNPLEYRPELNVVRSFASYFDTFAEARGFPNQREEYVPDPEPFIHLDVPGADESAENNVNDLEIADPQERRE